MKITNNKNLPAPLVRAIEKVTSKYDSGKSDITATGIIEPARIGALKAQYRDSLVEDASDLLYAVQGTSVHTLLEAAAKELEAEGYIAEKRYFIDVAGWSVSAQIDLFHIPTSVLQDYKITSVYAVKDGVKEDYAKQLNIQAECLRQNGFLVKSLQIVAILRDWSKGERDREQAAAKAAGFSSCKYPENQVVVLDVPIIPREEVLAYLAERVVIHQEARQGTLPLCTDEERWARPSKYAVREPGKKRATRLFDTKEAAELFLTDLGKSGKIELRPGENIRCSSYCPVSKFCSQWKNLQKG